MASALSFIVLLCVSGLLIGADGFFFRHLFRRAKSCPRGWSQYGSRCFIVQTSKLSMPDAERVCQRRGGNLASVHSYGEYSFIRRLVRRTCRSNAPAWIGLSDAIQEGWWMWTDGSKVNFRFWYRGEPNNLRGEDCTQINFGRSWNDLSCRARLPSVCVRRK